MGDIFQEIYNLYTKKVLTAETKKTLDDTRETIEKKYSKIWKQFKSETEATHGFIWKRKEPKICLLYPLDGRLSHKLQFSEIAFIEASAEMIQDETLFLHEVVKLINYTKPIFSWVKQDRRGIRAIAYELFTEIQTHLLVSSIYKKPPNFEEIVDKLDEIWIPSIRSGTSFDDDELERILAYSYESLTKTEFEPLYQLGELYTEMNIVLLE